MGETKAEARSLFDLKEEDQELININIRVSFSLIFIFFPNFMMY